MTEGYVKVRPSASIHSARRRSKHDFFKEGLPPILSRVIRTPGWVIRILT